ncbi:sulfotransferase family protein [Spirulina major]|uniref:sulfotransferase family protein n=1 Tax=Spirulina major TaxID=270636 RepID=UPI000932FF43|nr:sulfotransferase [Spirulina major]
MPNSPRFIIIGAMKCATSSLYQQLVAQPGIFMTTPKEPNFFSDDDVYAQGIEWYQGLFAAAPPAALCGEASTHYTKLPTYPDAIARLKTHLGTDVKLIYMMRHPVQRLVSHYIHEWTQKVIDTKTDINAALDRHPELIAYSQYSQQIRPYLETFGPENVLPIFFEQLCNAPQQELERVCQFIGYPGSPQWQELERDNVSSQRLRKSPLRDAIVQAPILKTIRKRLIPQAARDWVKGLWQMKQRPELAPEQLQRVTEIFDRDLAQLNEWLGTALTCATFKQTAQVSPEGWPGWGSSAAVQES